MEGGRAMDRGDGDGSNDGPTLDPAMVSPDTISGVATPASFADLAQSFDIPLSDTQIRRFDAYRSMLLSWNQRTNLTAVTDPAEVDRRLFLDSILLLSALDAALQLMDARPGRMIDVGSGAGFPGLPLKIMRPDLDITLVEATGKKVAFLDACIVDLGLEHIVTIHGRAEDLGHDPGYRERFDIVTARAVASLPALLELGLPFLHPGGRGLFPKGLDIAEELSAATAAAPLVGGRIVATRPLPGGQTTLVAVAKTGPTPRTYPRRAGIPAREPLGHLDRSIHDQSARIARANSRDRTNRPDRPPTDRPAAARGTS